MLLVVSQCQKVVPAPIPGVRHSRGRALGLGLGGPREWRTGIPKSTLKYTVMMPSKMIPWCYGSTMVSLIVSLGASLGLNQWICRVCTDCGKSWDWNVAFSRAVKSWNQASVLESHGNAISWCDKFFDDLVLAARNSFDTSVFKSRLKTFLFSQAFTEHWSDLPPMPLKLRLYGAI